MKFFVQRYGGICSWFYAQCKLYYSLLWFLTAQYLTHLNFLSCKTFGDFFWRVVFYLAVIVNVCLRGKQLDSPENWSTKTSRFVQLTDVLSIDGSLEAMDTGRSVMPKRGETGCFMTHVFHSLSALLNLLSSLCLVSILKNLIIKLA